MVRRLGKKIAADFRFFKGRKRETGLDRVRVIGYKSSLPGRRQGWPGGAKKIRNKGLTRRPDWVTKTVAARGARLTRSKQNPLTTAEKLLQY
jgi:hypothetical protein